VDSQVLVNGQPSKFNYNEGDKALDGSEIAHIIGRQEDYIVFVCSDGALCWEHRDIPDWAYAGIEEYERFNSKIPTFLWQIHKKDIKPLLGTSLVACFRSQETSSKSAVVCFKPVWEYINKLEDRDILHTGDGYYIYVNDSNVVEIVSSEQIENLDKAKIESLHYSLLAKHSLDKKQRDKANRLISSEASEFINDPSDECFIKSKSTLSSLLAITQK